MDDPDSEPTRSHSRAKGIRPKVTSARGGGFLSY